MAFLTPTILALGPLIGANRHKPLSKNKSHRNWTAAHPWSSRARGRTCPSDVERNPMSLLWKPSSNHLGDTLFLFPQGFPGKDGSSGPPGPPGPIVSISRNFRNALCFKVSVFFVEIFFCCVFPLLFSFCFVFLFCCFVTIVCLFPQTYSTL